MYFGTYCEEVKIFIRTLCVFRFGPFCEAYKICYGASFNVTIYMAKQSCLGGVKHSYWLFSDEVSKSQDRKKTEETFAEDLERRVCALARTRLFVS